jgi:hypothetical protein
MRVFWACLSITTHLLYVFSTPKNTSSGKIHPSPPPTPTPFPPPLPFPGTSDEMAKARTTGGGEGGGHSFVIELPLQTFAPPPEINRDCHGNHNMLTVHSSGARDWKRRGRYAKAYAKSILTSMCLCRGMIIVVFLSFRQVVIVNEGGAPPPCQDG